VDRPPARTRDLLADETTAAGTLPALYVTAVAEAAEGCRPLGLVGHYPPDAEHIRAYVRQAATMEGFRDYLDRYVFEHAVRAAS